MSKRKLPNSSYFPPKSRSKLYFSSYED